LDKWRATAVPDRVNVISTICDNNMDLRGQNKQRRKN
jgi:hypothetical protein